MEWASCKERFGNTPENEIRLDLSKLNPGGFRFQAMALRAILTADAVISEAGTAPMFGLFCVEVWCYHAMMGQRRRYRSSGRSQVWQTTTQSLGRPAQRAADCAAIRKSQETTDGACSILTAPGFFAAPDGSLRLNNPNRRKQQGSSAQAPSPVKSFCTAFVERPPKAD